MADNPALPEIFVQDVVADHGRVHQNRSIFGLRERQWSGVAALAGGPPRSKSALFCGGKRAAAFFQFRNGGLAFGELAAQKRQLLVDLRQRQDQPALAA